MIHVISEDGPALPYCLGRDRALVGTQPSANKLFRHFAVRSIGDQFVSRRATPEVHP